MADDELLRDGGTSEMPRSAPDQAWTGTGTPRSADSSHEPKEAAYAGGEHDASVITGATTSSHPAESPGLDIPRGGGGYGSGGPVTPDPSVEGSSGETMEELLGNEDRSLEDQQRQGG